MTMAFNGTHMSKYLSIALALIVGVPVGAQQLPAIRQIGKLERVSADSVSLASARTALAMPGGRVMFDDTRRRRILLLDSTLSRVTVVADTTSATANAYGMNFATLIRFHGDSALLIVPSTLSMFVIAPTGAIARTMAISRPSDANLLFGAWVLPGLDASGKLVYMASARLPGVMTIGGRVQLYEGGKPTDIGARMLAMVQPVDSTALVRTDFDTRALDTVAWARIPKFRRELKADAQGFATAIETTPDPLPVIDQWTLMRDGTLAIVRGGDFHIDWNDGHGHVTSSPKVAFNWKKVDDARKHELIDSTVKVWQAEFDGPAIGGRGTRSGAGGVKQLAIPVPLTALPDYSPPFLEHSVDSDFDGNLWIATTEMVDGRPVYYVVNRTGNVIDRVQLPAFRTVIGFGPSVIYLAVQLPDGNVHLERARIR
jgi:hypothetical protein